MEHLLFLVHRIPYPPNKGDKIRSYHLLKYLAQHYRVHLGTFVDDPNDWQHVDHVRQLCGETLFAPLKPVTAKIRSLRALANGGPLSLDYYQNAVMSAWVDRLVKATPIRRVMVFSSVMAQYAEHLTEARRIIDFVDIDSDKWRQYADKKRWPMNRIYRREANRLLAYEERIARTFDYSLFVSQAEAELFKLLAPQTAGKTGYFNNGVDTDYFSPHRSYLDPYLESEAVMAFTGAMDYWPNIDAVQWFADEVFPSVLAANPHARFYIVGSRPAPQVQALALRPGIVVTGTVPDVRPYLAHARVCVAPLRIARGIQNKVLEAMAMGKCTIVSGPALEGIEAHPQHDVLLCKNPEEFIKTIKGKLAKPDAGIGRAARDTVESRYGWASNLAPIAPLLDGSSASAETGVLDRTMHTAAASA